MEGRGGEERRGREGGMCSPYDNCIQWCVCVPSYDFLKPPLTSAVFG